MPVQIALLRGINVTGRNRVKMAELRQQLQELGCAGVRTYIQSGNIAFRSEDGTTELRRKITGLFEAHYEFVPRVMLLSRSALRAAVRGCPYRPAAEANPKLVHLFFAERDPNRDALRSLQTVAVPGEAYAFASPVLYMHTPYGFGRSKLAEVAESRLKVPLTARNWRTTQAVLALAEQLEGKS